jgi:hypothetical protein
MRRADPSIRQALTLIGPVLIVTGARVAFSIFFEGVVKETDWAYVNEILHAGYSDEDVVQITTDRLPFDDTDGMYSDCIGRYYYVAARMWWREFSRTTLLTTELVPAQIITALARRCPIRDDESTEQPYWVFRFDKPGLFADFVHIENHRDCKKQTLPRLIEAYGDEFPSAVVISDMAKDRVDNVRVITHLSARGSNELASAIWSPSTMPLRLS